MKFNYYAKLYLNFGKTQWKKSTFIKNSSIVKNRFSEFLNLDIDVIKPSMIKTWLIQLKDVGNKSKRHYINALNSIFNLALQDDMINKNPINFKIDYQAPKIKPFNIDEVNKIFKLSKKYNKNFQMFIKMGFLTGMRTGEILSLKVKEIDLTKKIIKINSSISRFGEDSPKTKQSKRVIPIIDKLASDLILFINYKNTYLFQTTNNKPYTNTDFFTKKCWKPILKELNLEYRRLYVMRHTYATNMLYKNLVSPTQLAKLLGHTNPKMIYDVYVNYLDENMENFNRGIKKLSFFFSK